MSHKVVGIIGKDTTVLTHFPNHNFIMRRAPTLIVLLQCIKVGLQRVLGLHLEGVSFIGIDSVVFVLHTTISMQSRKMNISQQHIVATDQQQETQCEHCWDVTANAVLNGGHVQELRMD